MRWIGCGLRRRVGLDLDLDLDLVRHQDATSLERGVPVHAEVLAVQGGRGGEAVDRRAHRGDALAGELGIEDDFLRDAVHGQVTIDLVVARALASLDPRALEGDDRVLLNTEEVVRAEVDITVLVARVDARRIDLHLNGGVEDVALVKVDGARELLEGALHLGEHHVLDDKVDFGVREIDSELLSHEYCPSPNVKRVVRKVGGLPAWCAFGYPTLGTIV